MTDPTALLRRLIKEAHMVALPSGVRAVVEEARETIDALSSPPPVVADPATTPAPADVQPRTALDLDAIEKRYGGEHGPLIVRQLLAELRRLRAQVEQLKRERDGMRREFDEVWRIIGPVADFDLATCLRTSMASYQEEIAAERTAHEETRKRLEGALKDAADYIDSAADSIPDDDDDEGVRARIAGVELANRLRSFMDTQQGTSASASVGPFCESCGLLVDTGGDLPTGTGYVHLKCPEGEPAPGLASGQVCASVIPPAGAESRVTIRLSRDDLAHLSPGSGATMEVYFGDTEIVLLAPPKRECYCGTGAPWPHEYAVTNRCEYKNHHCDTCHAESICTIPSCGFNAPAPAPKPADGWPVLARVATASTDAGTAPESGAYVVVGSMPASEPVRERDQAGVETVRFRTCNVIHYGHQSNLVRDGWVLASCTGRLSAPCRADAEEIARALDRAQGQGGEQDAHDRALGQAIDERDRMEGRVSVIAARLGCERGWSNMHDHADCIDEAIEALERKTLDGAPGLAAVREAHDILDAHGVTGEDRSSDGLIRRLRGVMASVKSMHGFVMEAATQRDRAIADVATIRAADPALPDDIRARGWAVAVHNDYRQGGEPHTFWLFTRDGRALKGEGHTDAEALDQVRSALAALEEARPPTAKETR